MNWRLYDIYHPSSPCGKGVVLVQQFEDAVERVAETMPLNGAHWMNNYFTLQCNRWAIFMQLKQYVYSKVNNADTQAYIQLTTTCYSGVNFKIEWIWLQQPPYLWSSSGSPSAQLPSLTLYPGVDLEHLQDLQSDSAAVHSPYRFRQVFDAAPPASTVQSETTKQLKRWYY